MCFQSFLLHVKKENTYFVFQPFCTTCTIFAAKIHVAMVMEVRGPIPWNKSCFEVHHPKHWGKNTALITPLQWHKRNIQKFDLNMLSERQRPFKSLFRSELSDFVTFLEVLLSHRICWWSLLYGDISENRKQLHSKTTSLLL